MSHCNTSLSKQTKTGEGFSILANTIALPALTDVFADTRDPYVLRAFNAGLMVGGTGNNMFSPRAVTSAQEASGNATATREQALIIALRMIENIGR